MSKQLQIHRDEEKRPKCYKVYKGWKSMFTSILEFKCSQMFNLLILLNNKHYSPIDAFSVS